MWDSTKLIMAALAVVGLALAFVTGQAVEESSAKKRNEQVMAAKLAAISGERDALQLETATAKQEHLEAKATVVALRDKMEGQSNMRAVDQADLRLYRRIANLDDTEQRGLFVDDVTMNTDPETGEVSLDILLIQTQGRNRIKGRVGATILPDTGKKIKLVGVGDENAPGFNLRFFQTVHIPVPETNGVLDELEIHVNPAGKAHKAFVFRIPWKEVEKRR